MNRVVFVRTQTRPMWSGKISRRSADAEFLLSHLRRRARAGNGQSPRARGCKIPAL